jgi:hypothetical protein
MHAAPIIAIQQPGAATSAQVFEAAPASACEALVAAGLWEDGADALELRDLLTGPGGMTFRRRKARGTRAQVRPRSACGHCPLTWAVLMVWHALLARACPFPAAYTLLHRC